MKKYKKFIFYFLFFSPLFFIFYFSFVYLFYFDGKDDSFSINTYLKYKEKYAESIKNNKIIFTSGSNNFLGIRASTIEKYFKIPAVNMSIHAGLRAEYILYKVKKVLKEGDIVIVPFEYSNFGDNGEPSIVKNKYILTYDKNTFNKKLDIVEKFKCLSSISVLDLLISVYNMTKNANSKQKQILLTKDLDRNGDMLNRVKHNKYKTNKPLFRLPVPITLETKGLVAIKNFNIWCKNKKVTFYITYPNIIYRKEYESKKYQKYFIFLKQYFKDNNISSIGTPKKAMYPKKYFYDSEYHLISKGSDIRTKDFINMLISNKRIYNNIIKLKH